METPPGSGIFDTGWVEWIDDGGVSRRGVRIVEIGWTEAQDPNDGTITITVETGIVREVVACGDWGTEDVHNTFDIPVYERNDVVWSQERTCGSGVHPGYAGGTWKSQQVRTTVTTRWPAAMNRPDRVTEARTEMSVDPAACTQVRGRNGTLVEVGTPSCHDGCYRDVVKNEFDPNDRVDACPTGYTGSRTYRRTRSFTWRGVAAPVPFVADHRVDGSEGAWSYTSGTCTRISTPGTNNSDDDDDDNGGYTRPRQTTNNNNGGNTGGNPGRGHPAAPDAGSNDGYNRNPQGWNRGNIGL